MDRDSLLRRRELLLRKAELIKQRDSISNAKNEQTQNVPVEQAEKDPSIIDRVFNIPSAAIREGIRSVGRGENPIEGYNSGAVNYRDSETFQNEAIRKQNELLDKSFVKNLPEDAQTLVRYLTGIQPSLSGMAQDMATNPGEILTGMATEGAMRGLSPVTYKGISLGDRATKLPFNKVLADRGREAKKASDYAYKATEAAEQLLKPGEGFKKDILAGKQAPMAVQSSKYITPAKNYTEITDQLALAEGFPMQKRAELLESSSLSNQPIFKRTHKLINELRNSAQNKIDAEKMANIQTNEVDFINSQDPSVLTDPKFYEARKEYYQKLAKDSGAYKTSPNQSLKSKVYKSIAEDYQDRTYAVDELVRPLNEEFSGLTTAKDRAADLAAVERGEAPPGVSKEIIDSIRNTKTNMLATLIRKITGEKIYPKDVVRLSKKTYKFNKKSEDARKLVDLMDSITEPTEGVLEGMPALPAPRPKRLQYQGSGDVIDVGGYEQPQLPETTESKLLELMKKYGVEKRSVRSSTKQGDIEPVVKSSKLGGEGYLPKGARKALKEMLERRKKNFGG